MGRLRLKEEKYFAQSCAASTLCPWYLNSTLLDLQAVSGRYYPASSQATGTYALHFKNANISHKGTRNMTDVS